MLRTSLLVLAALLTWSDRPLAAQCGVDWSTNNPMPHVLGNGQCSTQWDPDGAGPLPNRLVVGGTALIAGALAAVRSSNGVSAVIGTL